jgi:tetratricopeptide (TPR) repeat protein
VGASPPGPPQSPPEPEPAPRERREPESPPPVAVEAAGTPPVDPANDDSQPRSRATLAWSRLCELDRLDPYDPACIERLRKQIAEKEPGLRSQRERASSLVRKAISRSQAGDHRAAIELYLDAYQISPHPLLLSNLGAEYRLSGAPGDALHYFCAYLALDPTGLNAPYAKSGARAARARLGLADQADACARPEPVTTLRASAAPASAVP